MRRFPTFGAAWALYVMQPFTHLSTAASAAPFLPRIFDGVSAKKNRFEIVPTEEFRDRSSPAMTGHYLQNMTLTSHLPPLGHDPFKEREASGPFTSAQNDDSLGAFIIESLSNLRAIKEALSTRQGAKQGMASGQEPSNRLSLDVNPPEKVSEGEADCGDRTERALAHICAVRLQHCNAAVPKRRLGSLSADFLAVASDSTVALFTPSSSANEINGTVRDTLGEDEKDKDLVRGPQYVVAELLSDAVSEVVSGLLSELDDIDCEGPECDGMEARRLPDVNDVFGAGPMSFTENALFAITSNSRRLGDAEDLDAFEPDEFDIPMPPGSSRSSKHERRRRSASNPELDRWNSELNDTVEPAVKGGSNKGKKRVAENVFGREPEFLSSTSDSSSLVSDSWLESDNSFAEFGRGLETPMGAIGSKPERRLGQPGHSSNSMKEVSAEKKGVRNGGPRRESNTFSLRGDEFSEDEVEESSMTKSRRNNNERRISFSEKKPDNNIDSLKKRRKSSNGIVWEAHPDWGQHRGVETDGELMHRELLEATLAAGLPGDIAQLESLLWLYQNDLANDLAEDGDEDGNDEGQNEGETITNTREKKNAPRRKAALAREQASGFARKLESSVKSTRHSALPGANTRETTHSQQRTTLETRSMEERGNKPPTPERKRGQKSLTAVENAFGESLEEMVSDLRLQPPSWAELITENEDRRNTNRSDRDGLPTPQARQQHRAQARMEAETRREEARERRTATLDGAVQLLEQAESFLTSPVNAARANSCRSRCLTAANSLGHDPHASCVSYLTQYLTLRPADLPSDCFEAEWGASARTMLSGICDAII